MIVSTFECTELFAYLKNFIQSFISLINSLTWKKGIRLRIIETYEQMATFGDEPNKSIEARVRKISIPILHREMVCNIKCIHSIL